MTKRELLSLTLPSEEAPLFRWKVCLITPYLLLQTLPLRKPTKATPTGYLRPKP